MNQFAAYGTNNNGLPSYPSQFSSPEQHNQYLFYQQQQQQNTGQALLNMINGNKKTNFKKQKTPLNMKEL